jgi:hypothetical protein
MTDESLTDDLAKALRDSLYLPPGASDCLLIDRVREISEQLKAAKIEVYDLRKECRRHREQSERTDDGTRALQRMNQELEQKNHQLTVENHQLIGRLDLANKAGAAIRTYCGLIQEHVREAHKLTEEHFKEEP